MGTVFFSQLFDVEHLLFFLRWMSRAKSCHGYAVPLVSEKSMVFFLKGGFRRLVGLCLFSKLLYVFRFVVRFPVVVSFFPAVVVSSKLCFQQLWFSADDVGVCVWVWVIIMGG